MPDNSAPTPAPQAPRTNATAQQGSATTPRKPDGIIFTDFASI